VRRDAGVPLLRPGGDGAAQLGMDVQHVHRLRAADVARNFYNHVDRKNQLFATGVGEVL